MVPTRARRRGAFARALAAAALLGLALTGCAADPGDPADSADPEPGSTETARPGSLRPLFPATHPDVTRYCPEEDAVHLAELGYEEPAAELAAVYVCEVALAEPGDADEEPSREVAYRLVEPAELLLEYSEANEAPSDGVCAMMLADPLIVWVEDGEELVAVYAPVDECGFPQDDAAAVFDAAEREQLVVAGGGGGSS